MAEEGFFHNGDYVGQMWGCTIGSAREAAAEADSMANSAREFQKIQPKKGSHHKKGAGKAAAHDDDEKKQSPFFGVLFAL